MYSTTLIGFAALAAGVSVPVADAFGGGWRPGLAVWAIPAAIALLVWAPQLARRRDSGGSSAEQVAGARSLLHDKVAWAVTMFFAIQSAGFYTTLAWLPSVFHSHGASTAHAGLLLSIVPGRRADSRPHGSVDGGSRAGPAGVRVGVRAPASRRAGSE